MSINYSLEYNTERPRLIIPEYGRHIQKMIEKAVLLKDRDERNRTAHSIVAVMGNLFPHLRDVPDFQHKLWDQLFIMSDFKLDVDSPFEKPTPMTLRKQPERLPYPQAHPKYRFYGNVIADDQNLRYVGKGRTARGFGVCHCKPYEEEYPHVE